MDTPDNTIAVAQDSIRSALNTLRELKPKERDAKNAREWSVAITELEKVMAYFSFYVVGGR